ncbi:hypothetical protein TNCV_1057341 [Trichonephila clavipes]|nr:hypothetical protein TNCV_1057341 [Trichonephila clavipes]
MIAVDFLHHENPLTWAGFKPATLVYTTYPHLPSNSSQALLKISPEDPEDLIFSDKAAEVAEAVFDSAT